MSEAAGVPPTAAGHALKGQGFLARAEAATLSGQAGEAAGFVLLARAHFLAARTLDALATTELGREMRRDTKGVLAGIFDQISRLHGEDEPGLLAQASVG